MPKANSKGMLPNGKSGNGRSFTMLLHAIQSHPDYIALAPGARAFLWDMAKQFNGHNNGQLKSSEAVMAPLGYSKDQCTRYRRPLLEKGWIQVTREPRAKKEAALYRLAWLPLDEWVGPPRLDPGVPAQPVKRLK